MTLGVQGVSWKGLLVVSWAGDHPLRAMLEDFGSLWGAFSFYLADFGDILFRSGMFLLPFWEILRRRGCNRFREL